MSRFATRRIAERVLSYKVWERFNKNQAEVKRKKGRFLCKKMKGLAKTKLLFPYGNYR